MTIGTFLFTLARGRQIGADGFGNRYFVERRARKGMRQRRWVRYRGLEEASKVPAEWHAWLHYTHDAPIEAKREDWQKPHMPNLTGTVNAYHPRGSELRSGKRAPASGDYTAWRPPASAAQGED